MDALAQFLAGQGWRVICPDTPGRGLSQWSRAPREEYRLGFYARIARGLFDALGLERAHWVGTSMGGAIGTVCASGLFEPSLRARIATLVLNDNAPQLAESALARIRRSEEHTSELQSQSNLVCRLLLEKKKTKSKRYVM